MDDMKITAPLIAALFSLTSFSLAEESPSTIFEVMYDFGSNARVNQLKKLIEDGADVNAPIGFDSMLPAVRKPTSWPLDAAVQKGNVEMVTLLIAKGAKIRGGEMLAASWVGNKDAVLAIITALLKAGAEVNASHSYYGGTALTVASYKGDLKLVEFLLAQPGIKLDEIDHDGRTALIWAAENGYFEIVKRLIAAGADLAIKNVNGETALVVAEKNLEKQKALISTLQAIKE